MKHLLLVLLFITFKIESQNWNVFNSAYRYNYEFNNAGIITNVLFADTVSLNGNDTILSTNRIVSECNNRCVTTTVTVPSGKRYFIKNMPQFLQRKITKFSNGYTRLHDTASLYIKNAGLVGSTWLFDSVNTVTAIVVTSGIVTVFGQSDSVRTILLNNVDTLLLSKNFGILKFPELYAKNKYYSLRGIERNKYYDQNALYGQKVINAWDIHNYQVGDVFCFRKIFNDNKDISGPITHHLYQQTTITSKSITAGGYIYTVDRFTYGFALRWGSLVYKVDGYYSNAVPLSYYITGNSIMPENAIYPGAISGYAIEAESQYFYQQPSAINIGTLAKDLNGKYYKCLGGITGSIAATCAPSATLRGLYTFPNSSPSQAILNIEPWVENGIAMLQDGFGLINFSASVFELGVFRELLCFERNGVSIYGPKIVGINEIANESPVRIYPNPASNTISILGNEIEELRFFNTDGRLVKELHGDFNQNIDVKDLTQGLYFIDVKTSAGNLYKQKLLIQY